MENPRKSSRVKVFCTGRTVRVRADHRKPAKRSVKHAAAVIKSREIHIKSNSSSKQPSARYIMLSADIQLYYYLLSEVICMKPEIRKIITRSALFFGILTVSVAGMQLAVLRNEENAPDAVSVSADQSPVIVLDAGHGEST